MRIDLEDQALAAVLRVLSRTTASGILAVAGSKGLASFMLIDGRILFATSSTVPDLGESLVEKGYIGKIVLESVRAVKQRKRKMEPLGTVLQELGLVSEEVVDAQIEEQILKVLRDALTWTQGKISLDPVEWRFGGGAVTGARPVEELLERVAAARS